jgi:hypothetical protein
MKTIVSTLPPLSQSKFELMACPHLYVSRIMRGIQEPDNVYALRGSQFHKGASDYTDYLLRFKKPSHVEWFRESILHRPYLADALELLAPFGENFVIDPEKVLDAEFWLPLGEELQPLDVNPGNDAICYEGTLDLVTLVGDNAAIIDDYKTFFRVEDPDTFQSELYPLLLFKHFPTLEKITFRLQFVRYNVPRERVFTRADVPWLEKRARDERNRQIALHRTEGETFTQSGIAIPAAAMPGSHCAYCPKLQKGCPIATINPYTNQTPEERVRFAIWLTAAKKENDRILKDLINISGPVRVDDANGKPYKADFKKIPGGSYSAEVLPLVSVNDPELVAKLGISGLSSPLKTKKRAALKELCAPYYRPKERTILDVGLEDGVEDADEAASQAAD